MAFAVDGSDWQIYEGTLTPTGGVTIHYIMGWDPEEPNKMRGHLTSSVEGCDVTCSFELQRSGQT